MRELMTLVDPSEMLWIISALRYNICSSKKQSTSTMFKLSNSEKVQASPTSRSSSSSVR